MLLKFPSREPKSKTSIDVGENVLNRAADCPELQQPLDVSSSQGKAFHSLQAYTKKRCPGQPRRMFDLLARLTAAKAIPVEVVGELFFSAVDGHIGHGGMMVRLLFEGL